MVNIQKTKQLEQNNTQTDEKYVYFGRLIISQDQYTDQEPPCFLVLPWCQLFWKLLIQAIIRQLVTSHHHHHPLFFL